MEEVRWETRLLVPNKQGILTYITSRMPWVKCRIYHQGNLDTAILGPALVDSGAAGLLMPKEFADRWGIDLSTLKKRESSGPCGKFDTYQCTGFTVVIMGFAGDLEVDGLFTDCRFPQFPLLGISTVFQKYKVTINASREVINFDPY